MSRRVSSLGQPAGASDHIRLGRRILIPRFGLVWAFAEKHRQEILPRLLPSATSP